MARLQNDAHASSEEDLRKIHQIQSNSLITYRKRNFGMTALPNMNTMTSSANSARGGTAIILTISFHVDRALDFHAVAGATT